MWDYETPSFRRRYETVFLRTLNPEGGWHWIALGDIDDLGRHLYDGIDGLSHEWAELWDEWQDVAGFKHERIL